MGSREVREGWAQNQTQGVASSLLEEGPGMAAGGARRTPGLDTEQVSQKLGLAEASGPMSGGLCKPLSPPSPAES